MSQQTEPDCSKQWSCDTLSDGLKHVMGSVEADKESEADLLRQLKDTTPVVLQYEVVID